MIKKIIFLVLFFAADLVQADWNYNLSKYNISDLHIRGLSLKIEIVESLRENEILLSAPATDFLVLIKDKTLSIEDRRLLTESKPELASLSEKTIRLQMKPRKMKIFSRKITSTFRNWKDDVDIKSIQGNLKFENPGRLWVDLQKGQLDALKMAEEVQFLLGDVRVNFKQSELKGNLKQFKGSLTLDGCINCEFNLMLNDVSTELTDYEGLLKVVQNKSSAKYRKFKGVLRVDSFEGSQDVQFEPGSQVRVENKKADLIFRAPNEKNIDVNLKTLTADLFVPQGYKITPDVQGAFFRLVMPGEAQRSSLRAESDQGRIVFKFKE